ncbi:unnamed protein product [Rotaria sp. Silwood1]|nr:unnamed protein product [Rotaria sp. Silwood1]
MSADECLWGTKCQKWDFEKSHSSGRLQLCSNKDYSNNETCGYLHPPKYAKSPVTIPLLSYNKLNVIPDSAKEQSEMIELSAAKQNFLESLGKKILDKILKEEGIKNVKLNNGKIELSGNSSAIINVKSYLQQTLHEQNVMITNNLKKYLLLSAKGRLMKRFLQKYSVGISYSEILAGPLSTANDMITIKNRHDADERRNQYDNDHNMNQSEDEQEDEDSDDDDRKSTISNTSSNFTNISSNSKHRRNFSQKFIKVTLCNDLEDLLSEAIKELQSYILYTRSWPLRQDEIAYILKQSKLSKPFKKRVRNQCFYIKSYLSGLVQSTPNSIVTIFVNHKNGAQRVKVRGFKDHVNNAVSKIQNWLNDNVETEVQLPISKVMSIFLRTKASSDIKKMEKTDHIKITIISTAYRKHVDHEQDDDTNCLKLSGSYSHISFAREKVEDFLESLFEQEKQFSCHSWDISKNVSQSLRIRLKELQNSDDCGAIGWLKTYTATERQDITPQVTISIVGLNEEAVENVIEQCQNIVEGYVIWKLSSNEYRAIVNALVVKKSASVDEFRQQWETDIRLDQNTNTIIIPARSKMIADDIKEALLSLGEEKQLRANRISEFIPIQPNIRRFVNQIINPIFDEAKQQKVFVESKKRDGLKLHGLPNTVTELKQKINSVINEIKQNIITRRLQLSSTESNLFRTDAYKLVKSIERETNTVICDVATNKTDLTLKINENDTNSLITIVVNSRGQTIVVEKGDITKVKNLDAIVNAANGTLYHAGGVDKAIADAAGPAFDQECKQLIAKNGGLPISAGKVVKTTAGNLPLKSVIHAIGPQYTDGDQNERPLLFSSVLSSLRLAENERYASVALPAISSKTYGFPLADCTNIVVRAVKQFFANYPQSHLRKIILLDMDEAACNSFAREIAIDHRSGLLDDDDIINYELPTLTAKWCWQDDDGEKIYDENHARQIEAAFQHYLKTSKMPTLVIPADNLRSGIIVNYSIHFLPNLKQLLRDTPNMLNSRFVSGHQMRDSTGYKRPIIRYPVTQQPKSMPVMYHLKPLDQYDLKLETTKVDWDIIGLTNAAIQKAEATIRKAIESATISEPFSINLNKDFNIHKKELVKIAN